KAGAALTSFNGTFLLTPPPDSDVDLNNVQISATAVDGAASASTTVDAPIPVDAVADPVAVSGAGEDSGDAGGPVHAGESGTVKVGATFGDFTDGSETHTVTVAIPAGFQVSDPAGGTADAGALAGTGGTVTFAVGTTGSFSAEIGITALVAAGEGSYEFDATATATETDTGDQECTTGNKLASPTEHTS